MATSNIQKDYVITVLSNVDLNTINYNMSGYVSYATNSPSNYQSGMLLVVAHPNGSNVMQLFHYYNGPNLFVRYFRNSSGWGAWRKITDVAV